MPKKFFKPKTLGSFKGITPQIMRVFEQNPDDEYSHKEICSKIDANNPALRQQVYDVLLQLSKRNLLKQLTHQSFKLVENKNTLSGRIEITQRGSGFVVVEGEEKDIFIAPHNIGQAMHNDLVKLRIINPGKNRPEGAVMQVLEREKTQFVGTIKISDKKAMLIPDNARSGIQIQISEAIKWCCQRSKSSC